MVGHSKMLKGGGSKNYECLFQFLDPPKKTHTLTIWGGIKKFLDPPKTLVNISWNLALLVLQFGGYKKFLDPQKHTNNF